MKDALDVIARIVEYVERQSLASKPEALKPIMIHDDHPALAKLENMPSLNPAIDMSLADASLSLVVVKDSNESTYGILTCLEYDDLDPVNNSCVCSIWILPPEVILGVIQIYLVNVDTTNQETWDRFCGGKLEDILFEEQKINPERRPIFDRSDAGLNDEDLFFSSM